MKGITIKNPENLIEFKTILNWINEESSVLDLGCGDGELLSLLVKKKRVQAQGIEINQQAIEKCIIKGLNVFQEDIDSGLSDYPEKSLDYVILNQTFQQVKKPAFVLEEALRVSRKTIVGFPNFLHLSSRLKMCFGGKVPVTKSLPYKWYDTPNLHFFSIADFTEYCKTKGIKIEETVVISKNKKVRVLPNIFGEIGLFLLSK
ncbi:methionine biosynthesis protein MetW [Candidatus Bathyarchaeota archaeon]|nr:methionine biosynthesis protein MetW [Candidatus Bathyarchaeota archaeon]